MKSLLDGVMGLLFVLFMIFLIRGFIRQSQLKERDKHDDKH